MDAKSLMQRASLAMGRCKAKYLLTLAVIHVLLKPLPMVQERQGAEERIDDVSRARCCKTGDLLRFESNDNEWSVCADVFMWKLKCENAEFSLRTATLFPILQLVNLVHNVLIMGSMWHVMLELQLGEMFISLVEKMGNLFPVFGGLLPWKVLLDLLVLLRMVRTPNFRALVGLVRAET